MLTTHIDSRHTKYTNYIRNFILSRITITVHPFKLISWAHTEMYLANDWSKKYRHALDWLKAVNTPKAQLMHAEKLITHILW